ncbi:MAG: hypothetical protein GVY16_02910 [Planctomycetes bacterium]|nr:hypothetical protein [Planctomycetota bacterium]
MLLILLANLVRARLQDDDCLGTLVGICLIAVAGGASVCCYGVVNWGWDPALTALLALAVVGAIAQAYCLMRLVDAGANVASHLPGLAKGVVSATKLDKRAATAGKRMVRWLDKTFPAED